MMVTDDTDAKQKSTNQTEAHLIPFLKNMNCKLILVHLHSLEKSKDLIWQKREN